MTHAIAKPDIKEVNYTFRPSAFGAPRWFRLTANAIVWDAGPRSGEIDYRRVTRVRMSFRPASMQNYRFVTEIWSQDGPKLSIASCSWKSMAEQARLDREYRAFLAELHRRLLAAGTTARFDTGMNPALFAAGVVLVVLAGIGLAGLIVRAMEANAQTAALLVGIFLAVFVWYTANYLRRNRPGRYRPDDLPEVLLPIAKG